MMSCGFRNVLQKHELLYLLRIAFSAGLAGFIYGYYLGVINNFPPYMIWNGFNNSFARQCLPFESTFPWILIHGLGSTQVLILGITRYACRFHPEGQEPRSLATWPCLCFIVGAFVCVALSKDILCVFGILLIGYGTGYIFVGSTIYLAEISPTRIRGAMVATFFLQIAAGQITYYLISLASLFFDYSYVDDDKKYLKKYWHWMLGTIPALFMLSNWLPDSPNWLYALGKKEEAIEILRKTRPSVEDVAKDVEAFKLSAKNITRTGLLSLLPYLFKNMVVGIACLVAEHLVGMDMVMYYTPRIVVHILQLDQYSSSSNYFMLATLLIKSVLSAIGTLLCIGFVDRYGRRRLLLLTTFGIITCLGFLSFVLYGHGSDIAASCTITENGGMGNLGLLALGALGLYFIFHSMGIGTIPWIINTEIYSLEARICFGITAIWIHWFIKIGISGFYIYLNRVIGQYNIGNLFAILCLSSCVACYIIYVCAVDTTMEEVEKLLLREKRSDDEIDTTREEMPYMFSSSSSDDEGMNEVHQIDRAVNHLVEPLLMA